MRELSCGHATSTAALLDSVVKWWPNQHWALVECSECREQTHVELLPERVVVGQLDGGPGPAFVPHRAYGVRGLTIVNSVVTFCGRKWHLGSIEEG